MTADKEIYRLIADEMTAQKMDAALWIQATALAEGDPGKREAAYIRLRFDDLKKSLPSPSLGNEKSAEASSSPDDGMLRMRSELNNKIRMHGKPSLYSTLALQPDANDMAVAEAIAELEAGGLNGSAASTAEFKYAKTILGNPEMRKQYDRKLMKEILSYENGAVRTYAHEAKGDDAAWWSARNTSAVIGILFVALLGYWVLDYFRVANGHEIQKSEVAVQNDAVEVQRAAVQSAVEIEQQRIRAENETRQRSMAMSEESQRRAMDYQLQSQERMRMEQENRNALTREREKQQQQQTENFKAQREKQFWSCINQQLDYRDMTTSEAYARCGMYRR